MKKINIRKLYYALQHRYLTMNNVVIAVALLIGASWAWGSIGMMQRNFALQKQIDTKNREATLVSLEAQTLQYQVNYHKSTEYQELAVRDRLGLVNPGEKVLYLPPNSAAAVSADTVLTKKTTLPAELPSNTQLWLNFLLGGNRNKH